ncbi:hypothetical protein [Enterococcus thailandicus]|uniref:Rgg family transcriptional regulator n=1 Tax=Enterococcus thailandicus TaxID=417368 RepID=UPI0022E82474|nr:hypothetical protein [Enterococcus thailandicus]
MNHGFLIKKMRKARNISRSKLVIAHSSISSLKRFENDEAKIDFDTLWTYLERMNIQMDEYQLEYSNYNMNQKEKLRIKFKNILFDEENTEKYLHTLQNEYAKSGDVFYLYLAIQLKSVLIKLPNASSFIPTITNEDITILYKYLENVSDWGYFELAMYTNCLLLFENNYLFFNLKDTLAQFEKFKTSYKYKLVLVKFLINSLILSFERNSYDRIPELLETLYIESEDSDFMKGRIYWKFFTSLYHSIYGNFEIDSTIYIDMLALLGYEEDVQNMKEIEKSIKRGSFNN